MTRNILDFVFGAIFFALITVCQPAIVSAQESESEPGWVLAYGLVLLLFFAAVTIIAVRLGGRKDTVFSDTELNEKKEKAIRDARKH
ncbi:MAG: hypothetical protein LBJ00_18105 [Planctomycetaceae bacterium]|jgi:hypothetical protein|nr:hypothetical protein [Planctomycetaceae bacterium]